MLDQIIGLFKTQSFLNDMLDEFSQMLLAVSRLFHIANHSLIGGKTCNKTLIDFYAKADEVTEHERSIKRKIITHLTISQGEDVSACLVLMSMVKDAMRASDYSKNTFELITISKAVLDNDGYKTSLRGISNKIESLFGKIQKAIDNSDESIVCRILDERNEIYGLCNMLLKQLKSNNIPKTKALAYRLGIRYAKSVSGHLTNIATSIVKSIDILDSTVELEKIWPIEYCDDERASIGDFPIGPREKVQIRNVMSKAY